MLFYILFIRGLSIENGEFEVKSECDECCMTLLKVALLNLRLTVPLKRTLIKTQ